MDFAHSEDESMFIASCERLVREKCGFDQRRLVAQAPGEAPPSLWPDFVQLGLTGVLVPEAMGGLERELIDGALVAQTLGRGWLLEPYVDCALAAAAALAHAPQSGDRDAALAGIADGRIVVPMAQVQTGDGSVRGSGPHLGCADA